MMLLIIYYTIFIFSFNEYWDNDGVRGPFRGLPIDERVTVQIIKMYYEDCVKVNSKHTEISDYHCE